MIVMASRQVTKKPVALETHQASALDQIRQLVAAADEKARDARDLADLAEQDAAHAHIMLSLAETKFAS